MFLTLGCNLQVTDALEAIHPQLGSHLASLTWQNGPAPWQTSHITSHFPALTPEPGSSAMSGMQESVESVMHAAVAMHGLPVTAQPDSSQVLSCIRGLASVIGLVLHILALPGALEHAAGVECLEGVVAALARLTPAIHGYVIRDAEMLSGLITSSKPDVVQKAEEEHQLRQRAVLLNLLNAWKVCCCNCHTLQLLALPWLYTQLDTSCCHWHDDCLMLVYGSHVSLVVQCQCLPNVTRQHIVSYLPRWSLRNFACTVCC